MDGDTAPILSTVDDVIINAAFGHVCGNKMACCWASESPCNTLMLKGFRIETCGQSPVATGHAMNIPHGSDMAQIIIISAIKINSLVINVINYQLSSIRS